MKDTTPGTGTDAMKEQEAAARDLWRRLATVQNGALVDGKTPHPRRPPPRRRRLRGGRVLMAAGAVATLVAVLASRGAPPRAPVARSGDAGERGDSIATDARSDLPLRFTDGSTITFRAGSAGHVRRLTGTGAEVILERGRLEAHIVHAESTLWLVHAGVFRVRVTGTRLAVTWLAGTLEVVVYEGSVLVDGGAVGAGVPLSAGHRLTVEGGILRTEPVPAEPSPAGAATPTPRSPKAAAARTEPSPSEAVVPAEKANEDWFPLAERRAYRRAHRAAKGLGWVDLCDGLGPTKLLLLGDVARHAGAPGEARQAFQSLVRRFPGDRLTADAVFSLGRLEFEAGRVHEAERWFSRYLQGWPDGPLAHQASGRLIECALKRDDPAAARGAAEQYLARAPQGAHAALARQVLARPPGETP